MPNFRKTGDSGERVSGDGVHERAEPEERKGNFSKPRFAINIDRGPSVSHSRHRLMLQTGRSAISKSVGSPMNVYVVVFFALGAIGLGWLLLSSSPAERRRQRNRRRSQSPSPSQPGLLPFAHSGKTFEILHETGGFTELRRTEPESSPEPSPEPVQTATTSAGPRRPQFQRVGGATTPTFCPQCQTIGRVARLEEDSWQCMMCEHVW